MITGEMQIIKIKIGPSKLFFLIIYKTNIPEPIYYNTSKQ